MGGTGCIDSVWGVSLGFLSFLGGNWEGTFFIRYAQSVCVNIE
jgi:hypothetical protein